MSNIRLADYRAASVEMTKRMWEHGVHANNPYRQTCNGCGGIHCGVCGYPHFSAGDYGALFGTYSRMELWFTTEYCHKCFRDLEIKSQKTFLISDKFYHQTRCMSCAKEVRIDANAAHAASIKRVSPNDSVWCAASDFFLDDYEFVAMCDKCRKDPAKLIDGLAMRGHFWQHRISVHEIIPMYLLMCGSVVTNEKRAERKVAAMTIAENILRAKGVDVQCLQDLSILEKR